MRQFLPLSALLLAQACAAGPPIVASPSACSTLIPDSWHKPVPGAEIPNGDTVGEWIAFADAQTGQLDKANGRTADALGIIERCEKRDAAAVKSARPKVLGIF
jgi:hypothetical protein